METAQQLHALAKEDREKIDKLGRAASTLQVHQALLAQPITTAGSLVIKTGSTAATVNKCLGHLQRLCIVRELTARKQNRLFGYNRYVEIMNNGMELLES